MAKSNVAEVVVETIQADTPSAETTPVPVITFEDKVKALNCLDYDFKALGKVSLEVKPITLDAEKEAVLQNLYVSRFINMINARNDKRAKENKPLMTVAEIRSDWSDYEPDFRDTMRQTPLDILRNKAAYAVYAQRIEENNASIDANLGGTITVNGKTGFKVKVKPMAEATKEIAQVLLGRSPKWYARYLETLTPLVDAAYDELNVTTPVIDDGSVEIEELSFDDDAE